MSRPKVIRSGRRMQVSFETAQRINSLCVYPTKSSNGSLVSISGTAKGLHITWTGGRPLHFTSRAEPNATNGDHAAGHSGDISNELDSDDEALFESDEDDVDDDQPYSAIIQDLQVPLGSPVLHLALVSMPNRGQTREEAKPPSLLTASIVVAVACEDGSAKVIALPLDPPSAAAKHKGKLGVRICDLEVSESGLNLIRGVAMTWSSSTAASNERSSSRQRQTRHTGRHASISAQPSGTELLIALATSGLSGVLHLYRIPLVTSGSTQRFADPNASAFHTTYLDSLTNSMTFNPAPSSASHNAQLLIGDIAGHVSIYEVVPGADSSPSSSSRFRTTTSKLAVRLSTPYTSLEDPSVPALSHRKRVLAASWILSGLSILVLLEDGTVGLYALNSSPPTNIRSIPSPLSFAASAFIGDEPERSSTTFDKPKRSQLAPMTPNTRRTRSEGLFSGPTNSSSQAPRGGMTTHNSPSTHGTNDDAAVIYYKTRVCTIPSIREWWSRNAPREGPALHGTGMQDLTGLELWNEVITSAHIVPAHKDSATTALGGNALRGDLLIAGEYRTHLISTARQKKPKLFDDRADSPSRVDRRLLEQGQLGVDGLDRMLESMEGVERRVGFMD